MTKIDKKGEVCDYLLTLENTNLRLASNLLLSDIASYLNKTNKNLEETHLTKKRFEKLVKKLENKEIDNKMIKDALIDLMEKEIEIDELFKNASSNMIDEKTLKDLIKKVVDENPESITDFKEGRDRAVKFLMGQIMKQTKGCAPASLANELLKEELTSRN